MTINKLLLLTYVVQLAFMGLALAADRVPMHGQAGGLPAENIQESLQPGTMEPDTVATAPAPQNMPSTNSTSPATSAEKSTEAPTQAQTPVPPMAGTSLQPATGANPYTEEELPSPTAQSELYESARKDRLFEATIPYWAYNLNVTPNAYANVDMRTGLSTSDKRFVTNPQLVGIFFGMERMVLRHFGLLSLGLEGGLATGSSKDSRFTGLAPAIIAGGPYAQYQLHFMRGQWLIPTARFEYEIDRYSYTFNGLGTLGARAMPRIDLGFMFFLNILEPSSANEMISNFGISRTYLVGYYTIATDRSQQDVNLSENTFRIGLRFEQ